MSRTTATTARRTALAAGALALGLVLGACSETGPAAEPATTTASATATHNDADTEFAQMMIVHHEGAIEMAELAAADASTEEVRDLGERIAAAQGPEIDLMSSWMAAWGEPGAADEDMTGMDHGGLDMGGLSQEEAMAELEGADGVDVDRRFLELMLEHHRGAVEMAQAQLDEGADPAAVELAEQIIADQEAEIAEMEAMLAEL